MTIVKAFRIRRKSDGLYSTGGQRPTFSKKGKIWQGLGPLKNHLNLLLQEHMTALRLKRDEKSYRHEQFKSYDTVFVYQECELIEYVLQESETSVTNLMDIF